MQDNSPDAFDHDWGPFVDGDDLESKPPLFHFEIEGEDNKNDINGFTDLGESMVESFSSEVEFKRGSIAQRRAAKLGFDDSRIHVAQFKSNPPFSSLSSCSPFFTIPSGISPAALLESPVMLPNSQISPTTGTFPQASFNHDPLTVESVDISGADDDKGKGITSAAATTTDTSAKFFMCPAARDLTRQIASASSAENKNQAPQSSKFPSDYRKSEASIKKCDMSKSPKAEVDMTWDDTDHDIDKKPCISDVDNQIHRLKACIDQKEKVAAARGEDQKVEGPSSVSGWTRNAEDGYCWRKYGQKHVKGSEYPRSYYKCNNSSCLVKKKVERSHNGEITEIIYKGVHNHPKPQPRLSLGRQVSSSGHLLETGEDWRAYGYERTSSTTFLNGIPDPIAAIGQGKSGYVFGGSVETSELGSKIGIREGGGEDGATHGSASPGDNADGDESDPKMRKKEIFSGEAYMPSRSSREPRIILQMKSEIDVLEDGYRWRKYGQKVVKGNPNPRSYYKCTSAGCPVRKHVERASEDIKSVITTYEGKHNHVVPTAKSNGTTTATNCSVCSLGNSPPNASNPHPILAIPRNNHNVLPNPEIQVQELSLHYQQMKPNEFSQPNLFEDLVGDMNPGHPSIYHQMKFPTPLRYTPFVINSNSSRSGTQTSCIAAGPVMPDFAMAVPLSMVSVSNGFLPNNHSSSVQSSVGNQQMNDNNDLRFFKPKEEQKDDHFPCYPPS